ncbi:hypothetical protein EB796_008925 [Bugula neritina]|uniref:Uncharacterized protein n=1 Tax=Bugula neritina TaxID=10212 RepID=A0A7J7K2A7_BUGNE|nr:hypothetical protein EB796_008925 [Bugula neritina]
MNRYEIHLQDKIFPYWFFQSHTRLTNSSRLKSCQVLFSSLASFFLDILSGYSCMITSGYKQCHLPIHPVPDNTTKLTSADT